jgi:tetratricopeptide (TPR) repeat protein
MDSLLSLFSTSYEPPSLAAEIARLRAWAPPAASDVEACPALSKVILDYPGTAEARRALLDIAGAYARSGAWEAAEAPFRYVMEMKEGQVEARVAHLRLVELYRHTREPAGRDAVAECRTAVRECAGTPEEGLARLLLGDMLAEEGAYDEAFTEFDRAINSFPGQPYSSYARIACALALVDAGEHERAKKVIVPALEDPIWGGKAYYARGRAYAAQGATEAAIADYRRAAQTGDSVYVRAESYQHLAQLYADKGEFGAAHESLQACLATVPHSIDALDLRVQSLRYLYAAGRPLEAAVSAIQLETEAMNEQWRYSEPAIAGALRVCDEILDKCEAALQAGRHAQPSPASGRE